MAKVLQHLVSKQKKRFEHDGFDLDLTYITEQVIAMGLPCTGLSGVYRNPQSEVINFLNTYHVNQFKIYNLCTRPQDQYDPEKFGGSVVRTSEHAAKRARSGTRHMPASVAGLIPVRRSWRAAAANGRCACQICEGVARRLARSCGVHPLPCGQGEDWADGLRGPPPHGRVLVGRRGDGVLRRQAHEEQERYAVGV